jgi:hypothetical protein
MMLVSYMNMLMNYCYASTVFLLHVGRNYTDEGLAVVVRLAILRFTLRCCLCFLCCGC